LDCGFQQAHAHPSPNGMLMHVEIKAYGMVMHVEIKALTLNHCCCFCAVTERFCTQTIQ
jgi:hypothetical protein